MFRYGGPIKEGVMSGIREPKKDGGPTGTGLVGPLQHLNSNQPRQSKLEALNQLINIDLVKRRLQKVQKVLLIMELILV